MRFPPAALLLTSFASAVLAAPAPNPSPSFWGDLLDSTESALDDIQGVAEDVLDVAEKTWDEIWDGCAVTKCAASLGPAVLTCVVDLIDQSPLKCFLDVAELAIDPPSICENCKNAAKSFANKA